MSTVPQERREVPAADVKPGQHVVDGKVDGLLAEVTHVQPYAERDRRACVALMVRPLLHPEPVVLYRTADYPIRLATDAEIGAHRAGGEHREFVAGLRALADFFEAHPTMPRPRYPEFVHCVSGDDDDAGRAEIAFIGGHLDVPPTDDCHVEHQFGPVRYRAFYNLKAAMERYNADLALLKSVKASTGGTSPSVVGAEVGAAPSGPEGRDSGPDTPEHRHAGAWKGTEPGSCGVECACGETYDGFDSLAEAAALLDRHIETAAEDGPPDSADGADDDSGADGIGSRPLATGGSPADVHAAPARPAPVEGAPGAGRVTPMTAAGPEGRTESAPTSPPADARGEAGSSKPAVRVAAAPAAPAPHAGAAGVTPDRPSYDPNPTIDGRNPDQAYAEYADRLDEWAPGWHHDDQSRMATGLAREASNRLAAEAEQNGSGQ